MLIVEPSAARYELTDQGLPTDEHLLERISAVESRLTRLTERLERSLDLLLRQAQNSYFDRSLVKTLISILSEDGLVETSRLERLWSDRCERDASDHHGSTHRAEQRRRILSQKPETNAKVFEELISEAFQLIETEQVAAGIHKLETAAELAGSNSALNLFIGEHFFRIGKTDNARNYLSKAHDVAPDDVRVLLLLGLTCADLGEAEIAKEHLASAIKRGGSCFSGHYGLGWLHWAENRSQLALKEFKRALDVRPSPEAHFVLASLYFKMDRAELASRHLRKAVKMDKNYVEAIQLLALIYQRLGQTELAEKTLARVPSEFTGQSKNGKPGTGKKLPSQLLFDLTRSKMNRLLTGMDRRLESALREDALCAFLRVQPDRS